MLYFYSYYNNFYEGVYTLYRHKHLPYEVSRPMNEIICIQLKSAKILRQNLVCHSHCHILVELSISYFRFKPFTRNVTGRLLATVELRSSLEILCSSQTAAVGNLQSVAPITGRAAGTFSRRTHMNGTTYQQAQEYSETMAEELLT